MKRAIKKFVFDNKKQIIFALFALIYTYINKNTDVILMGVPVVVAETAKVAASEAAKKAAIKKAAVEGAKMGAAKGAVEAANNSGEDESKVGAAAKGAAKGAISGAMSGMKAGSYKENIKKQTDIKGLNTASKNNDGIMPSNDLNTHKASSIGSIASLGNAGAFLGNKLKSGAKNLLSGEEKNVDNGTSIENKIPLFIGIGCVSTVLIVFAIFIPLLLIFYVNPISDVFSKAELEQNETTKDDSKLSTFLEKAKNFFAFGKFTENTDLVISKAESVYNSMVDKYGVAINMPLLLSTIYSDLSETSPASEEKKIEIDNNMTLRVEYMEELAELQLAEDYVVYKCNAKEVEGEIVYYKEISYNISASEAVEGTCDANNINSYIKELAFGVISNDEYSKKLKEHKDILADMYGKDILEDEALLDKLIDEILLQKDVFTLLYTGSEDEEDEAGNIPSLLFYDENVNLTSPLKGNYAMTSSFGNRTGLFAGMHKGIDMVSNDHNIYAAGDGVVTAVYKERLGGNVIEITHTTSNGEKYITQYGHLSKFLTTKGATVKAGDIIAVMGATGVVSGVHLHFQVWKVSPYTLYNPKNVFTNL